MILYDMDWVGDEGETFESFKELAKGYGVKVRLDPMRRGREYQTFHADGPKEALRFFLAKEYVMSGPSNPLPEEKLLEALAMVDEQYFSNEE